MKQEYTRRNVVIAGLGVVAASALGIVGWSAWAQNAGTATCAGCLTTAAANPVKGTSTPDMANEAIQRSKARTAKLQGNGQPERFGSEEPFTYDPTK